IFDEPRKAGEYVDDEIKVKKYLSQYNISSNDLSKHYDKIVNQKVLKDWCSIYDSKFSPENYGDVTVKTQWENW
ncbi:TipC family immunity protein, partial [Streptococcus ferus]